jgi:uncharacterized membrane protein YhaH (DUF805 family)
MLEAFILLSGRLGRLAYFGYSIVFGIVLAVIAALLILPSRNSPSGGTVIIVTVIIVGLVGLWGGIALSVKRLHDLDKSGWHYAWMVLVPGLINGIGRGAGIPAVAAIGGLLSLGIWVYLVFWPGTPGYNRFGEQP